MMIHEITAQVGGHRKRKRVGRGPGSGHGKTCGRGHKGAGSRSGHVRRTAGEGGQMPLFRRIPKVGFTNAPFRNRFTIVNLSAIDARFDDGAEVNADMLVKVGLIRNKKRPVKILGHGDVKKKLAVTAAAFSDSAKQKIEQAGGSVMVETRGASRETRVASSKPRIQSSKLQTPNSKLQTPNSKLQTPNTIP